MKWILWVMLLLAPSVAWGQGAQRVPVCPPGSVPAGNSPLYMDANGNLCVISKPAPLKVTSLDISTVTTGGTAVNALSAGHASAGGFVVTANAAGICINEVGAAGTASSGDTACVAQNVPYYLAPTANAISVNSSSSSVTLAGYGFQ